MYNMKRLIVIALLATMMIGVTGCGNSTDTGSRTTTTTAQSTTQSTTVTTTASSADTNSVAANVYDGTGEKQGKKLVSIKWNEKSKINVINSMLHTSNVITKSGQGKEKTFKASDADKIYEVELVNKNYDNNYFFVYIIDNKVYMLGKEFAKDENTEVSGYADITVKEFNSLLK